MNTIHLMHHAMEERRNIIEATGHVNRDERDAKEVIRSVKGDEYLQQWIKDNFSLPSRVYRLAITEEAKKCEKEKAAQQQPAAM